MWEVRGSNATSLEDLVKPPEVLQQALCSRNCSGRGTCVDGVCQCPIEYTAPDCSVEVNRPPDLYGFSNAGLCDVRNHPCRKAYVIGNGFIDSPGLTCHVKDVLLVSPLLVIERKFG